MNRNHGSYSKLFDREITGVYQKGVATKIQQFMQSLRNHNTPENARRWVMELIQNARDVSYPRRKIDIQIELDQDKRIKFVSLE